MISKKNIYNLEKTKKFFKEYPLVLLYQHNNLTVKQRIELKTQLQSITTIKTLTVKNSLVEKISYSKQLENLVQGPLFLLGCQNIDDLKSVWSILKNCSSVLFLGSQYKSQLYTHLDIQKSLEINKTIYYEFFNILDQQINYFLYNYTKQTNSLFHCLSKNKD